MVYSFIERNTYYSPKQGGVLLRDGMLIVYVRLYTSDTGEAISEIVKLGLSQSKSVAHNVDSNAPLLCQHSHTEYMVNSRAPIYRAPKVRLTLKDVSSLAASGERLPGGGCDICEYATGVFRALRDYNVFCVLK